MFLISSDKLKYYTFLNFNFVSLLIPYHDFDPFIYLFSICLLILKIRNFDIILKLYIYIYIYIYILHIFLLF